jgi:hypothetical protein
MHHAIRPGTLLYRVTRPDETWPEVLRGLGAFYTEGGRYNTAHQATVYASEDALVAITEGAFHQARAWQTEVARFPTPGTYPFVSEHWLWCFTIDPPPPVIDLEHSGALHRFQYPSHLLLNPSQEYEGTQRLANVIRAYLPPAGSVHPRPEGLKAPSVRTPRSGTFQPHQYAFFVMPPPLQQPFEARSTLVGQWKLTLEFQEPPPRHAVTFNSPRIDWTRLRFRLGGPSRATVSVFVGRPGARAYQPGRWYRITVNYV